MSIGPITQRTCSKDGRKYKSTNLFISNADTYLVNSQETGRELQTNWVTELTCNVCTDGKRFLTLKWSRAHGLKRKIGFSLRASKNTVPKIGAKSLRIWRDVLANNAEKGKSTFSISYTNRPHS